MSLTYFVAGRRKLPTSTKEAWSLELSVDGDDEDDGVEVYETQIEPWLAQQFGFRPHYAVTVSPAWQVSEAVARELARAIDGAVYSDAMQRVIFDARGAATPCATRSELEERLVGAFEQACAVWQQAQGAAQEQAVKRFDALATTDPEGVARDNDWSDVS